MRKAPCTSAGQSKMQGALDNPEGVETIIHPAPSDDKEENT